METAATEPGRWLTPEDFDGVSAKDIRKAAKTLAAGGAIAPFQESTDYDVVLRDGTRVPPKAVFGHAARAALGIDVRPANFRGGAGTACFREIAKAGLGIAPKQGVVVMPADPEDAWAEGEPRRVRHLRYERSAKAVREKKRACREAHGELWVVLDKRTRRLALTPVLTPGWGRSAVWYSSRSERTETCIQSQEVAQSGRAPRW